VVRERKMGFVLLELLFLLCHLTHFDWTFGEKRSKYTIANRQFSDIQRNQMVMFNYRHLRNKWCSKDGEMRYIDNCQTELLLFFGGKC